MKSVNDETPVVFTHDISVEDVENFFVSMDAAREEPDVTPLKLQKLLYFAQANYLASTDQRLFNEDIEAYDHGPVVYSTYRRYSGSSQIVAAEPGEHGVDAIRRLPDDVRHFLNAVWEQYKDFSASQLRKLTHIQDPWRDNYVPSAYRTVIPDEGLASFFRQKVAAKDRVFHEAVVLVPAGFVDALDEDDIASRMRSFWS